MSQGNNTVEGAEHGLSGFANTLMGMFGQRFGASNQMLNFLKGKLTGMAQNPTGFTQAGMTALQTAAGEGVARDFNSAQKATQEMIAQRGGSTLPSGVNDQLTAGNANAAAQERSNAEMGIQTANAQLENENQWRAIGGLEDVNAAENPLGFAGATTGAFGTLAGLSNADTAARQSSFGGELESGLSSGLGKGLGSILGGAKIPGLSG